MDYMKSIITQLEQRTNAMTAEEVAEVLNISRQQVYKMAASGKLPSFRARTCVRFDPGAVAAFVKAS